MKIPILAWIIQGIPEQIALFTLALVIAQAKVNWKKVVLGGVILASCLYVLRLLPVTFGVHTLVSIMILFFLVLKFGQVEEVISIISSLLSMLALILLETICLSAFMSIFHITDQIFMNDVTIRILITLPQVFLLFILAFILNRYRKKKTFKIDF